MLVFDIFSLLLFTYYLLRTRFYISSSYIIVTSSNYMQIKGIFVYKEPTLRSNNVSCFFFANKTKRETKTKTAVRAEIEIIVSWMQSRNVIPTNEMGPNRARLRSVGFISHQVEDHLQLLSSQWRRATRTTCDRRRITIFWRGDSPISTSSFSVGPPLQQPHLSDRLSAALGFARVGWVAAWQPRGTAAAAAVGRAAAGRRTARDTRPRLWAPFAEVWHREQNHTRYVLEVTVDYCL